MAVVEMRRVTVLGQCGLRDAVLKELQLLGAVQVDDVREAFTPEEQEALFRAAETGRLDRAPGDGLEAEVGEIRDALDLLDRFFRPKKGVIETFAGIRFPVSDEDYRRQTQRTEHLSQMVERAKQLTGELNAIQAEESALRQRAELLRPWSGLNVVRQDLGDTRLMRVLTGQVAPRGSERLEAELGEVSGAAGLTAVGRLRDVLLIVAHFPKNQEEPSLAVLRRHDWAAVALPSFDGTVADELARVEAGLAALEEAKPAVLKRVEELNAERLTFYARYENLQNQLTQEESKERLGYTERVFALRGWARAKDVPRLREVLEKLSPALVLEEETPAPGEPYPVDLENKGVMKPFEVVTRVAGLPAPGALDPSPYLAPFFFLFFGIMLGDAGYGLLLTIGSLWLVKRARAVGTGRQLLYLMAYSGLGAILTGVLTGSVFGNLFGFPALLIDPMKDPVSMLGISVALGVVQIFAALGVKAYDNIRKGAPWDALMDQGFWSIFLAGLVAMLVSVAPGLGWLRQPAQYVAITGAVLLVLTQGRSQKNLFARFGSGLLSLYGVSAYMSDALSYSRLLALGLSGTVIAMVLNYGAKLAWNGMPVIGWILAAAILVAGHIFDLLISTIGAYVHASRLQYVEFFTKFFEAGGKPFKPLSEGHRYLVVERRQEV